MRRSDSCRSVEAAKSSRWSKIAEMLGFGGRRNEPAASKSRGLHVEALEERQLLAVLAWDPDGNAANGFGGTGNWTGGAYWYNQTTETYVEWNNANNDQAVFQGDAGTVTVNSAVSAEKVAFQDTDEYIINGDGALTLTGAGETITASRSATISAAINVNADQQWTVASEQTLSISGGVDLAGHALTIGGTGDVELAEAISGTGGSLAKVGPGTLALSEANTYTGGTTINEGVVTFANGSLGADGTIALAGNSTLKWADGNTQDISSRLSIQASATATLDVGQNTVTFAAAIGNDPSNPGSLTKTGAGTLSLAGSDRFGGVAINEGTLQVRGVDVATLSYGDISNSGALVFNSSGNLNVGGAISGNGTVTQQGAGTLIFTGTNSYSGGTTINSGTLLVGADGAAATSYTLTARLSAGVSGATVTFIDDTASTIIGSAATNTAGIASLNYVLTETAVPGNHSIRAVYGSSSLTGTLSIAQATISEWLYRKQVTISNTHVDSDLADFPLYVKINNDSEIGAAALANGYDIRFTASDGTTLLNYERESWSGGGGSAANGSFWVKVPLISHSSATTIYVYYGKSDATDGQNRSGVWDSSYKGVWHLPDGSILSAADASSSANNGALSATPPTATSGVIGGGASFNGSNNSIIVTNNSSLNPSLITVSGWVKIAAAKENYIAVKWGTGNGSYSLRVNSSNSLVGDISTTGGNDYYTRGTSNNVTVGNWYHCAMIYDGSNLRTYANGTQVGTIAATGSIYAGTANLNLGNYSTNYLNGTLDEIRVSNTARSVAWTKFEYYNTGSSTKELSWSGEQSMQDGGVYSLTMNSTVISAGTITTLTAQLSDALAGRLITFVDETAAITIGTAITNADGIASISYAIPANALTGSHTIGATYGTSSRTAALNVTAPSVSEWLYRKQITISNTNVSADLTDFPLYVKLSNDSDIGAAALANGYDIRFTASDGTTLLSYERESWSGGGGSAASGTFWVKVPTVSQSSATTIYVYYGKSDAMDGQSRSAVWNSAYRGVWHLPNGTTLSALDSTSNTSNGTITAATATTGEINGGASFNGTTSCIAIPRVVQDDWTISFWMTADANGGTGTQWYSGDGLVDGEVSGAANDFGVTWVGNKVAFGVGKTDTTIFSSALNLNTWYYVTATRVSSTGQMNLYIDGSLVAGPVTGPTGTRNAPSVLELGRIQRAAINFFDGSIDEVRISSSVRSAAWTRFEYYNMNSATNELSWSSQQSNSTGQAVAISSLSASPAPVASGMTVTLTLQLSSNLSGATVTFTDVTGSTVIGESITDSLGTASITYAIPANASGNYTLRATCENSTAEITLGMSPLGVSSLTITRTSSTTGTLGSGEVTNNASLVFNRSSTVTVGNAIGGTGSVAQRGAGTIVLSGANSYSGGTTVNGGTLQLGNSSALGNANAGILLTTGVLDLNGNNITIGSLCGTGGTITDSSVASGTSTLTVNASTDTTYAGVLQDGSVRHVALTKEGTATLTLSGSNTFAGGTTVNAGTLQIGNNNALSTAGGLTVNGGTVDLNGRDITIGSLSGEGGTITDNALNAGTTTLSVNMASGTSTYAGTIQDGATRAVALAKGLSGALVLTGTNAYTAGTTLNGGTLGFANGALGTTGTITFAGGTLQWASGNSQDISGRVSAIASGKSAILNTNGNDIVFGNTLSGAGSLTKTGEGTLTLLGTHAYSGGTTISGGTLQLGDGTTNGAVTGNITDNARLAFANASDQTFAGIISGSGSVAKNGTGWLCITGTNTYAGGTVINDGVLNIPTGTGSQLGAVPSTPQVNITLNGGALRDDANATGHSGTTLTLAANRTISLGSNGGYFIPGWTGIIINGQVTGVGGLNVTWDSGRVVLNGANDYQGATQIGTNNPGYWNSPQAIPTLQLGNASALPSGTDLVFGTHPDLPSNTATLDLHGFSTEVASLTGGSNAIVDNGAGSGAYTFTVGADNQNTTFGGRIKDTYGPIHLTKVGTGSLSLTGTNTYGGGTTISDGTLQLGNGGTTGSIVGNIVDNGSLVFANSSNQTVSGAISGTGDITKSAGGTLTLWGNNTSYQGHITINAGNLAIGSASALPNGIENITINAAGALNASGAYARVTDWLGSGRITASSDGAIALTSDSVLTENINMAGYAHLSLGATGAPTYSGTLTPVDAIYRLGGGSGTLTVSSVLTGNQNSVLVNGNVTLTGANDYGNGTTIIQGTLQVGAGGGSGTIGTGSVANNGALIFNCSNAALLTGLSGSGSLTKQGTGTLVLSGDNTSFSGPTTISGGTLQVGPSGTEHTLGSGVVTNNASLVFNCTNPVTVTKAISGSGSLIQQGSGVVTLTGTNTYSGGTTIRGGTLRVGDGGTAGSILGNVTDNGVLVFSRSDDIEFGGTISGSGTLTKLGANTLTLSGENTYTGNTRIDGGVLVLGNTSALSGSTLDYSADGGTLSFGSLTAATLGGLKGNRDLTLANQSGSGVALSVGANGIGTCYYSGVLSGIGSLTKSGSGTLTLSGTNTYSGGTTIAAGTLQFGAGGTTGSLVGDVIDNGVLAFSRSDDLAFDGMVSGSGGLTKSGAGRLTLNGANTFTGDTWITAGTLVLGNADALSGSALDYNKYGGALSFGGLTTASFAGLEGNKNLALTNESESAVALTVGSNGVGVTYSGVLSGSGSLTKSGVGIWTVTGMNTYSGGTTVSAGTLQVGAGGTSGNVLGDLVNDGVLVFNRSDSLQIDGTISGSGSLWKFGAGTLTLSAANTYSGGTSISAGTLQLGVGGTTGSIVGNVTDNGTFIFNRSDDIEFDGVISGSGGLSKLGAGTLTLNALNTYAGDTTIGGGELALGNENALSGSTLNYNSDGGSLSFGSLTAATFGGLKGNQDLALTNQLAGAVALTVGGNGSDAAFSGALSGSASLTKLGTGTLTLSGTNTYTGGTTIGAGTLQIGDGGTTGSILGDVTDNGALAFSRSDDVEYAGIVSGAGGLTKSGGGMLTLSGMNTYTGGTLISAGTLQLGVGGTSGSIVGDVTDNGVFVFNRSDDGEFTGIISGTGGLTKLGANTLTLNGTNTYTGDTKISGGVLVAGNAGALSGSTLDYNGYGGSLSLGSLTAATFGGLKGNQDLALTNQLTGDVALTVGGNGFSTTYSGVLGGSGSLTKSGAGTLSLSGTNTYTGGTTIAAGTLQIGDGGTTGSILGDVTDNGDLAFSRSDDVEFAAVISGSGSLSKLGAGTLTLSNANTYTGGTTITSGTFQLGVGGTTGSIVGDVTNNGTFVFNRSDDMEFSGVVGGSGGLTKLGANTLILSGANTFTGDTKISGGVLVLGNASALSRSTLDYSSYGGSLSFGALTAATLGGLKGSQDLTLTNQDANAVALTVGNNGSSTAYSGVIGGGGSLTKSSAGTLTLSGSNTYTGGTTISAGTLQIGDGGTSGAILGDVSDGGTLTFNRSDDVEFAGAVSGSGRLTKLGAGSLTLSGANTFTGDTKISSGTLVLANVNALSGSTLDYNTYGGSLSFGSLTTVTLGGLKGNQDLALTNDDENAVALNVGARSANYLGVLSGTGNLTKSGAGTFTLTGANTYTGGTTISAGTLQIGTGGTCGSIVGGVTNNGVFGFYRSDDVEFAESISGSGRLFKQGAGTLTLTGTNSYTGGTTIYTGTLQVGAGGTTGTIVGYVADYGVFAFNRSDDVEFGGGIGGTGGLTKLGANSLTLNGANAFTGDTRIVGGVLALGNTVALSGSTLDYNTYGGSLNFGSLTAATLGGLKGNQDLALANQGGAGVALTVGGNGASTTYSGALGGSGSLTKMGAGMLTLSSANVYTGATTISQGELRVTGSITSAVTVATGAVLSGTGTTGTVAATGSVSPGVGGAGTINTGDLTFTDRFAHYYVNVTDAGCDEISVTNGGSGAVSLNNADLTVTGSRTYTAGDVLVLIRNDGTAPITGIFHSQTGMSLSEGTVLSLGTTKFSITYCYNAESGELGTGNDVALVALPPEASIQTIQSADEYGLKPAIFRVTLAQVSSAPVTVNYTVGGSATAGVNYQAPSGTVVIPAGATTADITLHPIDDRTMMDNMSLTVTLASGSGYILPSGDSVGSPQATSQLYDGTMCQWHMSSGKATIENGRLSIAWQPGDPLGPQGGYFRLPPQDQYVVALAVNIDANDHTTGVLGLSNTPNSGGQFGWRAAKTDSGFFTVSGLSQDAPVYLNAYLNVASECAPARCSGTLDMEMLNVDLDVDSKNDSGFSTPDDNLEEDELEEDASTGKVIFASTGDIDNDGIVDSQDFGGIVGGQFVPMALRLPQSVSNASPSETNISLTYDSSKLRIWRPGKDASAARTTGDIIASGTSISASSLVDDSHPNGLEPGGFVFVFVEALDATASPLAITVSAAVTGTKWSGTITDRVHVIASNIDLRADTNRDNQITEADEAGKDEWAIDSGAIILLNSDMDNTARTGADCLNIEVDDNGDIYDIGPLWLYKLGMSTLPDDLKVTLSVANPTVTDPKDHYFDSATANNRVRIFLPTDQQGNDLALAEGDMEIIGPSSGTSVEFVNTPGEDQYSYSIFAGAGTIQFGIEGLCPGAMADITVTVSEGAHIVGQDTVRIKVTPEWHCVLRKTLRRKRNGGNINSI